MNKRLQGLKERLRNDFGKTTRWQVLCQEENATTDDHRIRLAERARAEPPIGTVAGGYAQWARLNGAKDQQASPYKPTGF